MLEGLMLGGRSDAGEGADAGLGSDAGGKV